MIPGFIYLTVESIVPNSLDYELAQNAVKKAEDRVEKAEKELEELKLDFTLQWFEDNNCVAEGGLKPQCVA